MDCDILVLGGGCAGLSLATLLADAGGRSPHIAILEPREAYGHDRTWSGWHANHRFSACARARWTRWALSAGERHVVRSSVATPYETIPADRVYDEALRAIDGSSRITLHRGVTAAGIGEAADRAWVETTEGRLTAALVVDTRPPPLAAVAEGLLQTFAGLEVETETPCFDASTVGLMDFAPASADGITFLYTLPFSPMRALHELTRMAPEHAPAFDGAAVHRVLAAKLGAFRIIRQESGCLPMRMLPAGRRSRRVLRLGSPAGALRPSTGYGFATIQAQAEALARLLLAGPDQAVGWEAPPAPGWMRFMDRLFLRVLRAHPEAGTGPADHPVRPLPEPAPAAFPGRHSRFARRRHGRAQHAQAAFPARIGTAGMSPSLHWQLLLCTPVIALAGLPHGATDWQRGRAVLAPSLGRAWALGFGLSYGLLMALAAALACLAPDAALPLFLAVAIWHFGSEDAQALGLGRLPEARLALGPLPILAPALFWSGQYGQVLHMLGAPDLSEQAIRIAGGSGVALAAVALALAWRHGARPRLALEWAGLLALAALAPPVLGFAVYFCLVHGPRHMVALPSACRGGPVWRVTLAAIAVLAVGTAVAAHGRHLGLDRIVAGGVFWGLFALTMPHLAWSRVPVPRVLEFGAHG